MFYKTCLFIFVTIFGSLAESEIKARAPQHGSVNVGDLVESKLRPTITPLVSFPGVNIPEVKIMKSKDMSPVMQQKAVEAFQRAYAHLTASGDRCSVVRQIMLEEYPEYKWHVVMYKAYSVQSVKCIEIKIEQDHYVLFAT